MVSKRENGGPAGRDNKDSGGRAEREAESQSEVPTTRFHHQSELIELASGTESSESAEFDGRDTGEFDSHQTIEYVAATVIAPPPTMDTAERAVERRGSQDPEEKATELWASAATSLFPGEQRRRSTGEDLLSRSRPAPMSREHQRERTPVTPAVPVQRTPTAPMERAPADDDSEEAALPGEGHEVISGEFLEHRAAETVAGAAMTPDPEHHDSEADTLLPESIEVIGEEGKAARELAYQRLLRRPEDDSSATLVVELRKDLPRLDHECRLCGRRIAAPRRVRLRGSHESERGFRCETCSNDFCALHVKRVSGLLESLIFGARFRCLLCMPEASPPPQPKS